MSSAKVTAICYVDPLCCWSYIFHREFLEFRHRHESEVCFVTRMAGMISDWRSFSDPVNSIFNPSQMGPHWLEVSRATGVSLDAGIWAADPPSSSLPACLAVKAAEFQSPAAADALLQHLHTAVFCERRNISRWDTISAVASELSAAKKELFDFERFEQQLHAEETKSALRQELRERKYFGIERFPSIVFEASEKRSLLMTGYRSALMMEQALTAYLVGS